MRTGRASAGRSRSAACTASIRIPRPFSSRGCRCGCDARGGSAAHLPGSSPASGNSLAGASPRDIMRQPPGDAGRSARPTRRRCSTRTTSPGRLAIGRPPRTHMAVDAGRHHRRRPKQGAISCGARIARHSAAAAGRRWLTRGARCGSGRAPDPNGRRCGRRLARRCAVWSRTFLRPSSMSWLTIRQIVSRERFFHWELEFPEVFFDADGCPLESGGFDAVIGNPPWDTLRGSRCGEDEPSPRALTRFSRDSGCYRCRLTVTRTSISSSPNERCSSSGPEAGSAFCCRRDCLRIMAAASSDGSC